MNCTKCAYVILSLTIILYNIWDFYAWIPPLCAFHQPPDLVLERPQHDLSGGLAHFGVPAVEGLEDLGEIGDEVALPDGVDFEGDISSLVFGFVRGGAELEFALEKRMLEENMLSINCNLTLPLQKCPSNRRTSASGSCEGS